MKVIRSKAAMQRLADRLRSQGRVGFVPTMGFLHEGHLSLVRVARKRCDSVVVSVFVNPTQFGPEEDLEAYPRDFGRDRRLLGQEGVDVVFRPDAETVYPDGFATSVLVERLTRGLCGRTRPGHFSGVLTVVAKLLNIVKPDIAVFGQKDAQQALVVGRMVRDLDFDTRIVVAPTVRERDGLAMSSRNFYLTPEQRRQAPVLYRSLRLARRMVRDGERDAASVKLAMRRLIRRESGFRIDYVEVVDTGELQPVRRISGRVLVAVAAHLGRARLIDNIIMRA
ncbi:MAG: pantoate--beta-alanine ligase [candidate division WOR-3 bacterium]|nr:MAG: pantoate--beta-alanine ligase [candidate division WOR-3 bacterium]